MLDKTGLEATFTTKGSGYITINKGDEYASLVHTTLLYSSDVQGELQPQSSYTSLEWYRRSEIVSLSLIPSMEDLFQVIDGIAAPFFDLGYKL